MSFFFRSNFLPSLLKRRSHQHHHHPGLFHFDAAPKRSLIRPIATAAAVASVAGVAYISYTSSAADRQTLPYQFPPLPLSLRLPALEKLAHRRRPYSPSDLTGPRLPLDDGARSLIESGDLDSAASTVIAYLDRGRKVDALEAFYLLLHFRGAELVNELISSDHIPDAIDVLRMMAVWPHMAPGLALHDAVVQGAVDVDGLAELFGELKRRYTACDRSLHSSVRDFFHAVLGAAMGIDPPTWTAGGIMNFVFWALWNKEKEEDTAECCGRMMDWGFYQSMLDPTTLNPLLKGLLEQDDDRIAVANKLFDKMLQSHKPPSLVTVNAETCTIMVNHRFKEGRVDEAVEIFRRIWEKEQVVDVVCLDNLVGKLRENGRDSDALRLYEEMPMVSVRAYDYGSIISQSFREGKWREGLDSFGKMLRARKGFDSRLYTKMVYGLMSYGCSLEAMDVLLLAHTDIKEMMEKGLNPGESGFGLGERARETIMTFYPEC